MKKYFFHSPYKYLGSFIYSVLVLIIYNSIKGWGQLLPYCDALFFGGFSLVCVGILSLVTKSGGFDMFSYMFARKDSSGVKPSYYDYTKKNEDRRKGQAIKSIPYFVIGLISIIISAILVACL